MSAPGRVKAIKKDLIPILRLLEEKRLLDQVEKIGAAMRLFPQLFLLQGTFNPNSDPEDYFLEFTTDTPILAVFGKIDLPLLGPASFDFGGVGFWDFTFRNQERTSVRIASSAGSNIIDYHFFVLAEP